MQLRLNQINNTLSDDSFLLAITDSMKVRLWIHINMDYNLKNAAGVAR
jgi:hypothetical protein